MVRVLICFHSCLLLSFGSVGHKFIRMSPVNTEVTWKVFRLAVWKSECISQLKVVACSPRSSRSYRYPNYGIITVLTHDINCNNVLPSQYCQGFSPPQLSRQTQHCLPLGPGNCHSAAGGITRCRFTAGVFYSPVSKVPAPCSTVRASFLSGAVCSKAVPPLLNCPPADGLSVVSTSWLL